MMKMSKAAKTAPTDAAENHFGAYTITVTKSGLLCRRNCAPFGRSIAPSSGAETHPDLLHRRSFDSVWRGVSPVSLLPPVTSAPTLSRRRAFPAAQQHLYHSRGAAGAFVPDHSRTRSGRLDATDLLRRNGVFQTLTGLPVYPNPITLRRLGVCGLAKLRRVHDHL